jgi:hypothetical protein
LCLLSVRYVDVEIDGHGVETVQLPVGAVYDLERFQNDVRALLARHESPPVRKLGIAIDVQVRVFVCASVCVWGCECA